MATLDHLYIKYLLRRIANRRHFTIFTFYIHLAFNFYCVTFNVIYVYTCKLEMYSFVILSFDHRHSGIEPTTVDSETEHTVSALINVLGSFVR